MIEGLEIREGLEGLTPARIITLYRRAPLQRRVDDAEKMWAMYERSSLVLTAWHQGRLAGVARGLTDGLLQSYLCDLAVEPDVQGLGIGRALIDAVLDHFKGTEVVLRDSDISTTFYAHMGFDRVDNAWVRKAQ